MKRGLIYALGIVILAFGLILNTKAALGTAAVVSIAYAGSEITGFSIGDVTLVEYGIFILIQLVLYFKMKKEKKDYLMVLLQMPFTLLFSRFMNLFTGMIPSFSNSNMLIRLLVLALAISLTALGVCFMLAMQLIPNPSDGLVVSFSQLFHKEVGLVKNCLDVVCVIITITLCLVTGNPIAGIGIGTVLSVIGVGRCLSLWNKLLKEKLLKFAGLSI